MPIKERIKLTQDQMNTLLVGVEFGFIQCESGYNLIKTLASVFDLFEVTKPKVGEKECQ